MSASAANMPCSYCLQSNQSLARRNQMKSRGNTIKSACFWVHIHSNTHSFHFSFSILLCRTHFLCILSFTLFILWIPSHISSSPPCIFLSLFPGSLWSECTNYIPPPFYSALNLSFFPLCWAWIFHSPHQICIPLIKWNYSRLPNIRCRWLSTQDARLWTSNDTASLSAELQPSEKRPRARDQRPSLMPKPGIKYRFLFPPAFQQASQWMTRAHLTSENFHFNYIPFPHLLIAVVNQSLTSPAPLPSPNPKSPAQRLNKFPRAPPRAGSNV